MKDEMNNVINLNAFEINNINNNCVIFVSGQVVCVVS